MAHKTAGKPLTISCEENVFKMSIADSQEVGNDAVAGWKASRWINITGRVQAGFQVLGDFPPLSLRRLLCREANCFSLLGRGEIKPGGRVPGKDWAARQIGISKAAPRCVK